MTGATGFIGSHILEKLEGYEIVALVSPTAIGTRNIPKKATIEFGDLTNFNQLHSLITKHEPNIIIHLGAITPVRNSFELPFVYQDVNYLATVNLVQAALKLPLFEKFIFASTAETYGWQKLWRPFTEDLQLNPASPYAVSKVAAENYIKMVGRAFNFPHIIMKCCNTFGRKDETNFVIEHIILQMLKNKSPQLGAPEAIRDFMFVDDHVGAYLKALEFQIGNKEEIKENLSKDINHYVFNFGWGSEFTIKQMAEKIKNIIGFRGEILFGYPKDYPWRPVVENYMSLNAEKARRIMGWQPKVPIDEGLARTVEYWKSKLS